MRHFEERDGWEAETASPVRHFSKNEEQSEVEKSVSLWRVR
jgi:hypothetical protein